jgi:hypothetical protein
MKSASEQKRAELDAHFKKQPVPGPELTIFKHLHTAAHAFIQVQQRREEADYDTGTEWNQKLVEKHIDTVTEAFESWEAIREEPVAQASLVSLLGKRPRSE